MTPLMVNNVYRRVIIPLTDFTKTYARINDVLLAPKHYVDFNVVSNYVYEYVVTAVGTDGVESIYSSPAAARIP